MTGDEDDVDVPDRVPVSELSFAPSKPWVYYCATCESYLDATDVAQHTPGTDNAHAGYSRIVRVGVVHT